MTKPGKKVATAASSAAAAATSGKNKRGGATASAAANVGAGSADTLKKVPGDWVKSTVKAQHFEVLREEGLLPPAAQLAVRAPGKETVPQPRDGERVCFVDFLHRGMSFPLHDFVRGLLYAYGIQLHDFTPNGVLHLACFVVMCECFLGVHPHWGLWKAIFNVKRNVGGGRTYPVGGFGIQVRGDTSYFNLRQQESVQGWRKKWFYVRMDQEGVPAFEAHKQLRKSNAWSHSLSSAGAAEVAPLLGAVAELLKAMGKEAGGIFLIATMMKRRVQPLRLRDHPMWQYTGEEDSTRLSKEKHTKRAVETAVRAVTNLRAADPCNIECQVKAFAVDNPLPEV